MPANGKVDVPAVVAPERAALRRIRQAEDELGSVVRDSAYLETAGRETYGIVGRRERLRFGPALRASGATWQGAVALWTLAFADTVALAGLNVVTPDMHLSLASGALGPFPVLRPALFVVGGLVALTLQDRRMSRPLVVRAAALATGTGLVAAALSTSSLVVFLAALVIAMASGGMATALLPLLFDSHRPELRVRIIGGYAAAVLAAFGTAQLLDVLASGVGLTWRAALLAMAVVPFTAAVISLRLGDPPCGRWDLRRIGRLVESNLGGGPAEGAGDVCAADAGLTRFERFRRSAAFSSAPAALSCAGVFGIFVWGFPSALEVFLRERWALVTQSSELFYAVLALATVPGVMWFAARAEVANRQSPRYLVQMASSLALVAAVSTAVAAVAPVFGLTVLLLWISFTAYATLLVVAAFLWLNLCPPDQRGHAALLLGALVLLGSQFGPQIVNTFGSRFGIEWAMVVVAGGPLGAAATLGRALATVDRDVDTLIGRLVETHELGLP